MDFYFGASTQSSWIQGVVDIDDGECKTTDLWIIELIIRLKQVEFHWMPSCFYDEHKGTPI